MNDIETLFHYLAVRDELQNADLILGFGVYDTRVPEHCAELYCAGLAPFILFSGGHGRGSGTLSQSEALFFRERALRGGVPSSAIMTEPRSTNTLENVLFSKDVLHHTKTRVESIILVAQPHRQRRVWHTCTRWMPEILFINYPPRTVFEDEITRFGDTDTFVSSLLGEVKRITAYGVKGDITSEPEPGQIGRIVKALETLR
jgi:uncharacterized SAM-binding protein YcdF (DUF218 family)